MKTILVASLALVLPVMAFAQQASTPSPEDEARMRRNAALLEKQRRSAAVVGGLVNQTPEYQQGYSLRLEAVHQREAAQAAEAEQEAYAAQSEHSPDQERRKGAPPTHTAPSSSPPPIPAPSHPTSVTVRSRSGDSSGNYQGWRDPNTGQVKLNNFQNPRMPLRGTIDNTGNGQVKDIYGNPQQVRGGKIVQ